MTLRRRIQQFFQTRYPLADAGEFLAHKTVPVHRHTFWYYWGGMTLALILVQFLSGLLLLLYYRPSVDGAFESVRFLMNKVSFGWLVRSVHAWAANLAVFSAFLHLVSAYFLKAYRPPRELTWVSGVLLFYLLLGFGFTGYLLPWNTLSFFATKVGTEIMGSLPLVGEILRTFLRGGPEVEEATLTRFFWFHVAVLPVCLAALLGIHLFFIQLQGMSRPPWVRQEKSMRFFPNFFFRDLVAWLLMLAVVLSLSVYAPAALEEKADPFAPTPAGIQPEWYFLWMFRTLKLFPGHLFGIEGELAAFALIGLAGLMLLIVPWLDRPARQGRSHWITWVIGVIGLLYLAITTGYELWIH